MSTISHHITHIGCVCNTISSEVMDIIDDVMDIIDDVMDITCPCDDVSVSHTQIVCNTKECSTQLLHTQGVCVNVYDITC
jgi:hypothetical protein